MKNMMLIVLAVVAPLMVLAQAADPAAPIGNIDALQQILSQLTSKKLIGIGAVIALIQVFMLALRSEYAVKLFGKQGPGTRLSLILGLSWLGGAAIMVDGGLTWGAALTHSTSMAAFQVFAHQIYTVYIEKKKQA
jgi:hypothetical protein